MKRIYPLSYTNFTKKKKKIEDLDAELKEGKRSFTEFKIRKDFHTN